MTLRLMSIVKRGNSKYWYIHFQIRGKTYIRSSRSTSKKVAEQMEVEWKSQIHAQQFLGHKERITIKAALADFCDSRIGTPNYKTLMSNKTVTLRLLSKKYLDELTSHDLEHFKRQRLQEGTAPATIINAMNLIRGSWKMARKLGYQTSELEFPVIKVPKYPLRFLTHEEERRLLACLDPKREGSGLLPYEERPDEVKRNMQDTYDLVVILLDTGARYGEIANIEWSRIDLKERVIRLWRPKVQNEGVIYMTDRVFDILLLRSQNNPVRYVFENRKGGPRGYVAGVIRKAMKKAGLVGCRIHTLRHTHASRLIQNGLSLYEVREVLGHTDIKTTMRYAHLESRQVTSKARDVINQLNAAAAEK